VAIPSQSFIRDYSLAIINHVNSFTLDSSQSLSLSSSFDPIEKLN
jgi:hypothetical protein